MLLSRWRCSIRNRSSRISQRPQSHYVRYDDRTHDYPNPQPHPTRTSCNSSLQSLATHLVPPRHQKTPTTLCHPTNSSSMALILCVLCVYPAQRLRQYGSLHYHRLLTQTCNRCDRIFSHALNLLLGIKPSNSKPNRCIS
jgi:hypothetical protein